MSRKKSQPETTRRVRPEEGDEASGLSIEKCERIPGFEKLATAKDRTNWRFRGHVPWRIIGPLLLSWFNEERGKIPSPDPFADYEDALRGGLKLMIEYYKVTPDRERRDFWIATLSGCRSGLRRAITQEAGGDALVTAIRALLDGTDVDARDAAG